MLPTAVHDSVRQTDADVRPTEAIVAGRGESHDRRTLGRPLGNHKEPRFVSVMAGVISALMLVLTSATAHAQIVASVLPTSRSVTVGGTATAFAAIINAGTAVATSCSISPGTSIPATFVYQTTHPATNQVTGQPNTPVNIPAGGLQTFVIAFTPTAAFAATDVALNFACANTDPAPSLSGSNTLL